MDYVVVIGDLVGSRSIVDRRAFQRRFLGIERWAINDDLASPYTVTLGDEIQAVYTDPRPIFRHIWQIAALVRPHRLRVSVAVGPLSTRLNRQRSIGMDGPALQIARSGIEQRRRENGLFIISDIGGPIGLANSAVQLAEHLVAPWRDKRYQVLSLLAAGRSPQQIARTLKISLTAVYKNIGDGALHELLALGDDIGVALFQRLAAARRAS